MGLKTWQPLRGQVPFGWESNNMNRTKTILIEKSIESLLSPLYNCVDYINCSSQNAIILV